jgi:hypothetical protein
MCLTGKPKSDIQNIGQVRGRISRWYPKCDPPANFVAGIFGLTLILLTWRIW